MPNPKTRSKRSAAVTLRTLVGRARRRHRRGRRRWLLRPLSKAKLRAGVRLATRPSCSVVCFYQGFDPELDRKIRKLARRPGESGMALWLNLRDLEFHYATETKGLAAAKRIKAASLAGVRVMVRHFRRA